jgi:peptidoglycan/LPS O-acetylase OafA/YrhL
VGLVSFLVRIWSPAGEYLEPLHIQPAHLPQYIPLFILGIVGYRCNWLAGFTTAQARLWRWVAIALVPVWLVVALYTNASTGEIDVMIGGPHWQSLVYALWEQIMFVAISVTLVVWFRERLNAQGPVAKAMSGASFSTYLLHAPTIVLLGWALKDLDLPLALKFVVVAPFGVALSFLVGYLARKLPLAREVL